VVRRRRTDDRRSYALSLTPSGKALQKRAARAFDAAADEVLSPLKVAERHELAEMLRKVILSADRQLKESSA
jgi:DNA-binding MarR family transcriptional regulator